MADLEICMFLLCTDWLSSQTFVFRDTIHKMKKVAMFQKAKPFVRYSMVMMTILILAVFLVKSDGFSFSGKASGDEEKNLRLSASSKYAASMLEGIDNNDNAKTVNSNLFDSLIAAARKHPRGRKMTDLTKLPESNTMQTLMNTWIEGSYSPVHYHDSYSEVYNRFLCTSKSQYFVPVNYVDTNSCVLHGYI